MARQKRSIVKRIGQAVAILLLVPLILPLATLALTLYWFHKIVLYRLVWSLWIPRSKDVLLVYSESPIWVDYMTR
jgi:hypothetical protein